MRPSHNKRKEKYEQAGGKKDPDSFFTSKGSDEDPVSEITVLMSFYFPGKGLMQPHPFPSTDFPFPHLLSTLVGETVKQLPFKCEETRY